MGHSIVDRLLAITLHRPSKIGRHRRVLKTTTSNPAIYKIRGNEAYVRAKVIESNGKMPWTQPVFVRAKPLVKKKP